MKIYTGCADVREDFSALLDGELEPDEREALEAHLFDCADCLRELDGLKRVDTLYGALPAVNAPENFETHVKQRQKPGLLRFPATHPSKRFAAPILAAAAGLLIVTTVSFYALQNSGSPRAETQLAKESTDGEESDGGNSGRARGGGVAGVALEDAQSSAGAGALERAEESMALAPPPPQSPAASTSPDASQSDPVASEADTVASQSAKTEDWTIAGARVSAAAPELEERALELGKADAAEAESSNNPIADEPVLGRQLSLDATEQSRAQFEQSRQETRRTQDLPNAINGGGAGSTTEPAFERSRAAANAHELDFRFRPSDLAPEAAGQEDQTTASTDSEARDEPARSLLRRDGTWYQEGYADEPVVEIARDSEMLQAMVKADVEIARFLRLSDPVILKHEDEWFKLLPPSE